MAVITLVILWSRAPTAAFVVFLVWTVFFYSVMIVVSRRLRPRGSVIAALCSRLPYYPSGVSTAAPPQIPTQESPPGPYVHHQPLSRIMSDLIDGSYPHSNGPRSVETIDDDDDLDEDTRQRMIEEEMGRRDVSIVTVPKRKLWITNPS